MRRGPLLLFWPLAVSAYESGSRGGEGGDALKISSALPPPPPGLLQLCSYSPRGTGRGGEVPSRSIQNRRVGFTFHRIHFATVIEFPCYMSIAQENVDDIGNDALKVGDFFAGAGRMHMLPFFRPGKR